MANSGQQKTGRWGGDLEQLGEGCGGAGAQQAPPSSGRHRSIGLSLGETSQHKRGGGGGVLRCCWVRPSEKPVGAERVNGESALKLPRSGLNSQCT